MNSCTKMKLDVIKSVIEELKEVPSGELYAFICGGIDISEYTEIIDFLVAQGSISSKNHLLSWKGNTICSKN